MLGASAYVVKAHTQPGLRYDLKMQKNKTLREVLALNVSAVMEVRRLSQPAVAAAAKKKQTPVDQTTVGRVKRGDFPASVDTIEAIANGLGVEAWQLLMPGFKPEPAKLTDNEMKEVVQARQLLAGLTAAQRDLFLQDGIVKDILTRPHFPVEKMGDGWKAPKEKGKK